MAEEDVRAELAQLRRRIDELEQRLARSAQTVDSANPVAAQPPPAPAGSLSRRAALKSLGSAGLAAGVGVAVAGASIVASSTPAAAANGAALVLGSNANAAESPTGLEVTGTDQAYGFAVTDNGLSSVPVEVFEPAILGHAADEAFDIGVVGYNATVNPGVLGYSALGTGVWGRSAGSAGSSGVLAQSPNGIGAIASGGQGALLLDVGNATSPPNRSGQQYVGLIDADESGNVWLCVESGPPANWVRLGGPGTAGAFTVLPSSVRVYDSRPHTAPRSVGPKTPLAAGKPRAIRVNVNNSHVPATATAVVVNATVVPSSRSGQLTLYKAGTAHPGTTTLSWSATAHPVANSATVAIAGGKLEAAATAKTDLIIDVIGYHL